MYQLAATSVSCACGSAYPALLLVFSLTHDLCPAETLLTVDLIFASTCCFQRAWTYYAGSVEMHIEAQSTMPYLWQQHHWSRLCLLLHCFHCSVTSRAVFSWPKFCPHFCARLLSTGFGSSEELMSVGTSALRDLKASMQSPGYLLSSGCIFLLTLGTPVLGLQFCFLGCRVLSFFSV